MHDVETLRSVLLLVLQAMESMSKELSESKAENGKLRDEINRLKGEKGRPEFKRKQGVYQDAAARSGYGNKGNEGALPHPYPLFFAIHLCAGLIAANCFGLL